MSEPTPEEIAAAKPVSSVRGDLQQKASHAPDIHRLLPASSDAEQGVLCSFLLAPKEVGGLCVEKHITKDAFHIPAHAMIYGELLEMWDKNQPIDFITLTQRLSDRNLLDQVGGAAFITSLFCFLPTASNASWYIETMDEKHTLREIIRICTEYAARSYEEQHEVQTLLDELEAKVLKIRSYDTAKVASMKDLMMEVIGDFDKMQERKGAIGGMSTGFADLDRATDGLHDSEVVILAARPSHGKSALMGNIAEHVAITLKLPVALFSLEMSSKQLGSRMLCSQARINAFKWRDGFISERDFPAITSAAGRISAAPIHIDDTCDVSIQELRAKLRRLHHEKGIKVAFIDYLQLLRSSTKRGQENRQIEISEISRGLKVTAKELGIPLVVLCQIGRGVEKDNRRPRLSDLRESGSIEQDADGVWFLTREELYAENDDDRKQVEGKAMLTIAKQRSGPLADVPLTFLKEFTRFEQRAREHEEEETQTSMDI